MVKQLIIAQITNHTSLIRNNIVRFHLASILWSMIKGGIKVMEENKIVIVSDDSNVIAFDDITIKHDIFVKIRFNGFVLT